MAVGKKKYLLQIGSVNWSESVPLSEEMEWIYLRPGVKMDVAAFLEDHQIKQLSAVLLEHVEDILDLSEWLEAVDPYTVFYPVGEEIRSDEVARLVALKQARAWDMSDPADFVSQLGRFVYSAQYGDRFPVSHIQVRQGFKGSQTLEGSQSFVLEGAYGEDYTPLLQWKYNYVYGGDLPVDIWLEYEKDASVSVRLTVQYLSYGAIGSLSKEETFSELDMEKPIVIAEKTPYYLGFSLEVKGQGQLRLGNLHKRYSHGPFGQLLVGGDILRDQKRQELIVYFHPGDLKPPLNIYFSGFRPAEGFEGYWMMRSLGAPFILFGDPRLEGGSFYMGTEELEGQVVAFIQQKLDELGFGSKDVVLSGLSMGTYGALYYGVDFSPHAIVIGKPLVNIGDIAANLKFKRPNEFQTSLDMLYLLTGEVSEEGVTQLNARFWDKFERANFQDTLLALAYMQDDDYDQQAYPQILQELYNQPVRIISKSRPGRHNDASSVITDWFFTQYKEIMERDFGRSG
ncbi:accessory Sec system protein Asp2 [Streptococcus sp. DD13]|uniref:accessory Sec system protein Asp2 n=1 Tax=Streptococcus sp. DD13 TaxID=1777881 RepID=UPI0007946C3D|nr:accessory Sec system protein Asp2 [Streptococcus sp. DD13]KXT77736.1 Accessory secretory protein Asp2 [Streptococcus sp. DD13]